jgi:hypothetical protein
MLAWSDEEVLMTAPAKIAFNQSSLGFRDEAGTLHLTWSDGSGPKHAVQPAAGGTFAVGSLPMIDPGAAAGGPSLARVAGPELVAAWIETSQSVARLVLAHSADDGAS